MHRFYLSPEQCGGSLLVLTGREAHHACRVLRVRPGEQVTILNGAGDEFLCDVQECRGAELSCSVVERHAIAAPSCRTTLVQALPKGKLIETIIQKATELGVWRIVPLLTERVVVRIGVREAPARQAQWKQVAIEAIKQSGSAWLPVVEAPMSLEQFLGRKEAFDLQLVGSLQPEARHPREYLRDLAIATGAQARSVAVWIGPEGDFTPAELNKIRAAGALPITLGRLVLRTDTAATYCLSIINYELQSTAPG